MYNCSWLYRKRHIPTHNSKPLGNSCIRCAGSAEECRIPSEALVQSTSAVDQHHASDKAMHMPDECLGNAVNAHRRLHKRATYGKALLNHRSWKRPRILLLSFRIDSGRPCRSQCLGLDPSRNLTAVLSTSTIHVRWC